MSSGARRAISMATIPPIEKPIMAEPAFGSICFMAVSAIFEMLSSRANLTTATCAASGSRDLTWLSKTLGVQRVPGINRTGRFFKATVSVSGG